MSASSVIVAPDSTGKEIQTWSNTVGGHTVQAQAIVPVTSAGVEIAGSAVTSAGSTISADTTIAAGAVYVDLLFSSDFSGTLLGATVAGSTLSAYSFPPLPGGRTYPAIAITRSAGSVIAIKAT